MDQAKEPDNIIWEHLYIRGSHYFTRVLLVVLICIFVIFFFFVASVYFTTIATRLETYYPDIDCGMIQKDYTP